VVASSRDTVALQQFFSFSAAMRRAGLGARVWTEAEAPLPPSRPRIRRALCRQCSRATSADRIAKAIVPVGDIA
jgi:hypothetical protein